MAALDAVARSLVVDAGVAPGAAVAVGARSGSEFVFGTGAAGVRSATRPEAITPETPFDLASVTKPVVASAIARLVREGRFTWATPLGSLARALSHTVSGPLPLSLFISHRAGLEPHRSLFAPLLRGEPVDRARALEVAAEARRAECLGAPPLAGFPPVYSDVGYLLAGNAVSECLGVSLGDIVARAVCAPLGLDAASSSEWALGRPDFLDKVAPTETVPWRGGEIVGMVHDENAWALGGRGLSGHAGLFATAEGVARFGAAMIDALDDRLPTWLSAEEARFLVEPRPGGTLRAGFDGRSTEGSSAGSAFGARAFGHLGFTGTSLWCDPDAAIVAVALTNRVSPTRENTAIRAVRPALHDALFHIGEGLAGRRRTGRARKNEYFP